MLIALTLIAIACAVCAPAIVLMAAHLRYATVYANPRQLDGRRATR